jgi:hypothetical protein
MATIDALRTQLFATLEALNDKDKPMDIDRAKAVAEVAQVIINSAKVEVEHLKVTGGKGTGFIADHKPELPAGVTGVTRHRLAG